MIYLNKLKEVSMKQKATSWFYTLGLLFFVAGLALFSTQFASAATTKSYSENYTVLQYRNVVVCNNTVTQARAGTGEQRCSYHVTLGPSAWRITGNMGTDNFTEDWNVKFWDDATNVPGGDLGFTFNDYARPLNTSGYNDDLVQAASAKIGWNIEPSGLYGAMLVKTNRTGVSTEEMKSVHSWPTAWTITGTITTP
jgi:hypothetical protein